MSYLLLVLSVNRADRWMTAKSCHTKFATDLEGKWLQHAHELCVKGNKLSGELLGFRTNVSGFSPRWLRCGGNSWKYVGSEINQIHL
jgi:hypothetical protein